MIQINPHGDGFIDTVIGRRFVPVGTNYAAMLDMVNCRGQPRRFTSLFGVDRETEADGLAERHPVAPHHHPTQGRLGVVGVATRPAVGRMKKGVIEP